DPLLRRVLTEVLHVLVTRLARHERRVIPTVNRVETGNRQLFQDAAEEAEPRWTLTAQAPALDHVQAATFGDEALTVAGVASGDCRDPELVHQLLAGEVAPALRHVSLVLDLVEHDRLRVRVTVKIGAAKFG